MRDHASNPVRVLLVDDNVDFLAGVADWLRTDSRWDLVGTACCGTDALAEAERLRPDVVLLDATMPDLSGFEVTRRMKAGPDAPHVVVLTLQDSQVVRDEAAAAGAEGFVAKSAVTERLFDVITEVLK